MLVVSPETVLYKLQELYQKRVECGDFASAEGIEAAINIVKKEIKEQ